MRRVGSSLVWLVLALSACDKSDTNAKAEPAASAARSAAPTPLESEPIPLGCNTQKREPSELGNVHGHVYGFAADATHLYVSSWQLMGGRGDLVKVRKDGRGTVNLTSLALEPRALVVDDKQVFFTAGIRLMSIPKEAGESKVLVETFSSQGLAADASYLYGVPGDYGPYDRLVRAEKSSGTTKELDVSERPEAKTPPVGFSAIAVDSAGIDVTDSGGNRVLRFPLDCGKPKSLAGRQDKPYDLAIDDSNVYVSLALAGHLMKVPKAGGAAEKLASGLVKSARIAVDSKAVFTTLAGENEKAAQILVLVPSAGGEPKPVGSVPADHSVEALALDEKCLYWVARDGGSGKAVVFARPR